MFAQLALGIEHARQQDSSIGDEGAAGLEHQRRGNWQITQMWAQSGGKFLQCGQNVTLAIAHGEATADIQRAQSRKFVKQRARGGDGPARGGHLAQLAADVDVQAREFQRG